MTRAGYSLIELILVIVVVSIAAVSIGSAYSFISRAESFKEDLLIATQAAQECADHIIGRARRPNNYSLVPTGATACNVIAVPTGFTRTVTVTGVVGPSGTICTGAGWACKSVVITLTRGSATASANLMLINY